MEISPEERPVPALAHCLASASGFCGFCAIWDAKTIMVYHYRCKIIFFSWYLYIIIMVKPSWYIIKARQQSSCLLIPFKHSPKRIEQLQTGKFMGKHHLYHSGTTCLFCLGAIWMFFFFCVSFTYVGYIILHSTFGDWLLFARNDQLLQVPSYYIGEPQ